MSAFTEQHYVSIFFTCLWPVRTALSGIKVGWWLANKKFFVVFLTSLHFCLSFGFVFIRMRS